jgi:hypothetical protein
MTPCDFAEPKPGNLCTIAIDDYRTLESMEIATVDNELLGQARPDLGRVEMKGEVFT